MQLDIGRLATALDFDSVQASQGVSSSFGLANPLYICTACLTMVIIQWRISTMLLTDVCCCHLHLHSYLLCMQRLATHPPDLILTQRVGP